DKFLGAVKRGRERLQERSQESVVAGVGSADGSQWARRTAVTARTASSWSAPFNAVAWAAALVALALTAWNLTASGMRGMDSGPGTDLGGLGWYLGIWVTMMAAMMLPSVAPMVLFFARVSQEREILRARHLPTWLFVAAYFVVWTAYGLAGYALY